MEEILLENYSLIIHTIEFIAAITGVILFKKYNSGAAKFFISFLVYIAICDLIGNYTYLVRNGGFFSFLESTPLRNNYWWTTLTWFIGAIVFYCFYYNKILKTKTYKVIVKYAGFSFITISISYILFNIEDYFVKFFPFINVFGALIIFLCTMLYFIEILKSEYILTFYKSLNFYISSAILIWWLIVTPMVFYDIYFSKADWNFVILKWQIYMLANIFMYTTFTIGLIYSKPENV